MTRRFDTPPSRISVRACRHDLVIIEDSGKRFIRCIVCGEGPNYWVSAMGRLIPPALP